jgi:hypothetical protein
MTVKVLEHNGIYTAYRRIIKRSDDGQLYESVKRINLPFPPTDETLWPVWAVSLNTDALDAGLQIFFDKWNFGNGSVGEEKIYQYLCDERDRRKRQNGNPPIVVNGGSLSLPAYKRDPTKTLAQQMMDDIAEAKKRRLRR